MKIKRVLQALLVALAGGGYLALSYLAAAAEPTPATTLFGLLPFAALAVGFAWNSRARLPALAGVIAAAALVLAAFDFLRQHAAWLYFIQHAGAMSALALTFGATLGEEPARALCSRIAMALQPGGCDAALLRYTWNVTLAWTVFFVLSALASALLFAFAPIEAWSAFANVGTPLLLGAMFVGEYLVRLRLLPDQRHISIAGIIQTYREHARSGRLR
jgi:uncharacterized membrane protein